MLLLIWKTLSLLLQHTVAFQNPIRHSAPDPSIVYAHGYYHLTYTSRSPENSFLEMTRSPTLGGLRDGETRTIWADLDRDKNANMWAPEIHRIDGTWYLFYSSCNSYAKCCDSCAARVLRGCNSPEPYTCDYSFLADLIPPPGDRGGSDGMDSYSIDGSYLEIPGKGRYHLLAMRNKVGAQSVAITELDTNSWTVKKWHVIAAPEMDWEMHTTASKYGVVEAPHPLNVNGDIFLSYSGSGCDSSEYALGLLHYNGGDPLSHSSWERSGPVFRRANGLYGTGHNCFFLSPDGKEFWNAYHACEHAGGYCGPERFTMAQRVNFYNGVPILGEPQPLWADNVPPSGE